MNLGRFIFLFPATISFILLSFTYIPAMPSYICSQVVTACNVYFYTLTGRYTLLKHLKINAYYMYHLPRHVPYRLIADRSCNWGTDWRSSLAINDDIGTRTWKHRGFLSNYLLRGSRLLRKYDIVSTRYYQQKQMQLVGLSEFRTVEMDSTEL